MEHFDVLVVGAGLSGIGAAVHLQRRCPDRSFALLEARDRLGGTWDLFRYPGVRSDSDMYTLGYAFKPWEQPKGAPRPRAPPARRRRRPPRRPTRPRAAHGAPARRGGSFPAR